jgi:hypothetical protein
MKYNAKKIKITELIKKKRNFGILNRFLNGVRITRIDPNKLLIKNLGYRKILVQKLFINDSLLLLT